MNTKSKRHIGISLIILSTSYALLILIALTEKLMEAFSNGYTLIAGDAAIIIHIAGVISIVAASGGWLLIRKTTRPLRLWSISTLGVCLLCFGAWALIHGWSKHTRRTAYEIKRNL